MHQFFSYILFYMHELVLSYLLLKLNFNKMCCLYLGHWNNDDEDEVQKFISRKEYFAIGSYGGFIFYLPLACWVNLFSCPHYSHFLLRSYFLHYFEDLFFSW